MFPENMIAAEFVRGVLTDAYIKYAKSAPNQNLDPLIHVDLVNALTKALIEAMENQNDD